MSDAVDVCAADELAPGERRRVVVAGAPVLVVRCRDAYRAIADTCSHEDFPLSEGEVDLDECLVECWKHGSMFSLDSGEPVCLPATQPVRVYVVEERDGRIVVLV